MFKFIAGLVVGFICIVFFFQNNEIVSVNFFFWTLTLARYLLLFCVFLAGLLSGWLFTSFSYIKKRRKNK